MLSKACNGPFRVMLALALLLVLLVGREAPGPAAAQAALAAPTGLRAEVRAGSGVHLSWQDNARDETGYELWRWQDASGWTLLGRLPADATSYGDGGAAAGASYWYVLAAFNGSGYSPWAYASVALPLAAPTDLRARVEPGVVRIQWKDSGDGEEGYDLWRFGEQRWERVARLPADSTSFEERGLPSGARFTYYLAAYVGALYSEWASTRVVLPGLSVQVQARLRLIEERVSADRGIGAAGDIRARLMTREEYQASFRGQGSASGRPSVIQEVLEVLGALEKGQDLARVRGDFLGENVLGFFDTATGDLVVITDGDDFGPLQEVTYAHEYAHALQQRRFDIFALQRKARGDSEARAALRALIEGDATLVQSRYIISHLTAEQTQALSQRAGSGAARRRTPAFLIDSELFPYRDGLRFVLALYNQGGWEAVDRAYAAPPTTTEQVLHPEKYLQREGAVPLALPDLSAALGAGWEHADSDTLGELDIRSLLRLGLRDREATAAAAGWGGDRYAYLRGPGGQRVLASLVAWDTAEDAREFRDAYGRWLGARGVNPATAASGLQWTAAEQAGALRVQGAQTMLVLAPALETAQRVLAAFPQP